MDNSFIFGFAVITNLVNKLGTKERNIIKKHKIILKINLK